MKKILSMALCLAILAGALTMLCGIAVFAEGNDYEAQQWKPVEIQLTSAVNYQNAYLDAEIDAEFVHSDGTTIKSPGFWKEGNTWCVRFSPTKTGSWTYTVTCSDTSNTGLHNIQGTINAVANTGDTMIAKHGFLKIPENGRYMCYDDGTPFFWLGDTNWQAPNYISTTTCNYPGCNCGSQFEHEVNDRAAKGFNVYQTYFDTAETDGGGQRGKMDSIWTKQYTLPNVEVFNNKIDYMFDYLLSKDMTVALGFGVHTSTMTKIGEEDFLRFVRYCVARYGCYSIAWISGQEITNDTEAGATKGKQVQEVYMAGSALVSELDGYNHPNGAHMYPMPAADKRAQKLDDADWHEWWTLQGGHGQKIQPKSFYQSYYANTSGKIKPYIETEANYEDINCGGFTGYDANRYSAWNAVLNGSVGFTYGVTGIWANCYSTEKNTGWYGEASSYSYEPWYIGLSKPGSYEVSYMKKFFETFAWQDLVPRFYNTEYADFAKDNDKLIASNNGNTTVVAYFFNTDQTTGVINKLDQSQTYHAMWFNPLTGKFIEIADDIKPGVNGTYIVPAKPTAQDWALLITCDELKAYETEEPYKDLYADDSTNTLTGNIITPAKVTAIGGILYLNGKMIDVTDHLYDNKGITVWEPTANRSTQTILYDLGAAYSLSHIAIVPTTGTVLPAFRVEASNDGVTWKIITNTALRDAKMSEDGTYISEKLAGDFRYVKILLLNAEDIDPQDAKNASYKVFYNSYTDSYYSKTSIAEISVFGTGIAEDVKTSDIGDKLDATPAPTENGNNGSGDAAAGLSGGTAAVIIAGAAVVGVVIGVVVAVGIKKKKGN